MIENPKAWTDRFVAIGDNYEASLRTAMLGEFSFCAEEVNAGRWDWTTHAHRVELILERYYAACGNAAATLGRAMIAAQLPSRSARPPGLEYRDDGVGFGARVSELIRVQAPLRARAIGATTNGIVNATLAQAVDTGLGNEAAARLLRDSIADGAVSLARARMIARTEMGAAANAGLLAGADAHGAKVKRKWACIEDERVRATHFEANDQEIEPGGRFHVGNAFLEYPGDPKGPAKEIINCRCTMLLEYIP